MKHFLYLVAAVVLVASCCQERKWSDDPQIAEAEKLCARILPRQSRNIDFKIVPADTSYYALEMLDGRLLISGNNVNSLAVGLGSYLRNQCKIELTWFARDKVREPRRLPAVEGRICRKALVEQRFFFNYCTFGYTLPWWQWKDWERLIDWMAIHGVTLALANTGVESSWLETWKEFGLTEEQISAHFTGPAFLPWNRMTNIDGWHGPLPESWLEGQKELQRKIIAREKALGISPILSAFSGHVPSALKNIFPDAQIVELNRWAGFDGKHNAWYLNPSDTLFRSIQKTFLRKQKEIYGDACHVYAVDLFNEMNPPSWEEDFLEKVSRDTYETLSENDPEAVWLQMGWLFWNEKRMWTPERIKAYVSPVPKGKLVLLDYYVEKVEIFRQTENFYDQDFIWSYLGNFGGETMIAGDFYDLSARADKLYEDAPTSLVGLGCTLEALDVNPMMYEYVLDRAWEHIGDEAWINAMADSRAGAEDEHVRAAWHLLCEKVHKQIGGHRVSQLPARPSRDGKAYWNTPSTAYDNKDLLEAWGELLKSGDHDTPSFRFDCVNWARQCLDNHFTSLYGKIREAYAAGDAEGVKAIGSRMLEIARDVDELVASDTYFLLGKWIEMAREWGVTPEEKDYYETDARLIVSTWGYRGGPLNDYSNHDWNGLIGTYSYPRWEKYVNGLYESLAAGEPFDFDAFKEWCFDFEWDWAHSHGALRSKPAGNPRKLSQKLYGKYAEEIRDFHI